MEQTVPSALLPSLPAFPSLIHVINDPLGILSCWRSIPLKWDILPYTIIVYQH